MSSIPPPEAAKGVSASTLMVLLTWAFIERKDLGEPFVALLAGLTIVCLALVLILGKNK